MMGNQRPAIRLVPPYVSNAGAIAIEVAALAGLDLDPWQQYAMVDSLGRKDTGKWASFRVGLEVGRQNGKGSILEARELAGAFAFGEKLIIHSAHEQLTSSEHFRRILTLIEGVPEFEQRVLKVIRGKGSEAIELRDGQRIFFKTRTNGGGRGLTGDLVVLDEAMILMLTTMAALIPTMAARSVTGNPQLWYAGSSINRETHEHGAVFARIRQLALNNAPNMTYLGFCANVQRWREAHGLPYDEHRPDIDQVTPELLQDPIIWAEANPGLGRRISVDHVGNEYGDMPGREFAIERCGIADPPAIDADADRVVSKEVFARCGEHDRSIVVEAQAFALDVNPERTWSSIAVAGERGDGDWQYAVRCRERGTEWVLTRCAELHEAKPDLPFVVLATGPAANFIVPLEDAGITVVKLDAHDFAIACSDWFDLTLRGEARYPAPQVDLDEALIGARKSVNVERAWTWSRKTSTAADISPLVAVTLALWGSRNAESEYATAVGGEPITQDDEGELIGAQAPVFLTEDDLFDCFACRVLGHPCERHAIDPEGDA